MNERNSSFWFDNWTNTWIFILYRRRKYYRRRNRDQGFVLAGSWNETKLLTKLSQDMTVYIMESIKNRIIENGSDRPWWIGNTKVVSQLNMYGVC